jgi:hypothetical protein
MVLCDAPLAGELIILAPGVKKFGEDPGIDSVIRQYGYRTTPEIMEFLKDSFELRNSLRYCAVVALYNIALYCFNAV